MFCVDGPWELSCSVLTSEGKGRILVRSPATSRGTLEKAFFRGVLQKDKGTKVLGCNK